LGPHLFFEEEVAKLLGISFFGVGDIVETDFTGAEGEIRGGRVAPEGCSSEAPTDPDTRDYRIRLFRPRLSYVTGEGRMRGCGKG
jgi:hypothetical protein